ncbi:UNVERIFIED_CONTAM: putative mitochondrial protein [Sesamum angustifolium]|uniref:Mitochondrial protein n=1 Tax=Sesamum angustifolium TaxID=2727405 RepID=A0AAW2ISZ9_9LAMI
MSLASRSVVGSSKKGVFSYIRDRVWQRIKGCCEKNLSQAGKATMIQLVLQAIPTFAMSVFKLSDSLIAEIQGMLSNFFWHNNEKRKIHWINWSRLCYRKCDGGLGFRSLKAFNLAMLAKQLWRLLTKPQCLLSQVLKAGYYPFSSPLEAKVGYRPYLTWHSIISSKEIIAAGSRWSVGSGFSIIIWKDPWLPRPSTFKIITPPPDGLDQNVVAAMIDPETKEWDRQIIEKNFNLEDQELILKIPFGRESLQTLLVGITHRMVSSRSRANRLSTENISSTPQQTVIMANSFLAAYREANVSHSLQHVRHKNRLSKWSLLWLARLRSTLMARFFRRAVKWALGEWLGIHLVQYLLGFLADFGGKLMVKLLKLLLLGKRLILQFTMDGAGSSKQAQQLEFGSILHQAFGPKH